MTDCTCHIPPRIATHRLRSGQHVCPDTAQRITDALARDIARRTPEPLAPDLFTLAPPDAA